MITLQNCDYTKIYEATITHLKFFEKLIDHSKNNYDEHDRFLLLLLGNINVRFNTVFILLNNSNSDGVFPLIRTIYEMNIAFKAYLNSDNKQLFIDTYHIKKNSEASKKAIRFLKKTKTFDVTTNELEMVERWREESREEMKGIEQKKTNKTWFEIASKKDLHELSIKFQNDFEFFLNYALTSDWVHPQKIDENISNQYTPFLSNTNEKLLSLSLLLSLNYLDSNMADLATYLRIVESNGLYNYGEMIGELKTKVYDIFEKIEVKKQ